MSIFSRAQTRKTIATGFILGAAISILIALLGQAQARPLIVCNQLGCSDNPNIKPHQTDRAHQFSARRHYDAPRNSVSLAGIVAPLKAKAEEIVAACGSRVVSAYRPGARIPTGRLSNHARHRAVDLQGNPSCIYRHLKGWPGGYSTDYSSAPGGAHVHISYNRNMEWGARFAHRRTRTYHARAR